MKANWQSKKLGDLLSVQNGYAFDSKAFGADGFPLIRIRDLKEGVTTETKFNAAFDPKYIVNAGDFLIGMDGDFTCHEWKGPPALLNQRVCRLQEFNDSLEPRFLFYGINAHLKAIEEVTGYTTVKHLSSKQILGIEMVVPPRIEQRRILTLLDEAFADIATAIANAEKNLQNARELFESHLDAALDSHAIDHIATTLGAEVDLVAGFAFSSSRYSNHHDDVRLLRGDNIMQGYLRWEDVKRWPKSESASHEKFALKEGDVVLAMDRPWVKAGLKRAQMVTTDLPCLQVQRTARLRPKQNLRADFLFHLTGSQAFSRHLLDVQTGIGVPHISGAQIQDFKFMRPPLEKQALIASELQWLQEEIQRLESIYRQKLTALDDLKKSLLHQAFSGQL